MSIRAVACDLDGTLLTPQGRFRPHDLEQLGSLRRLGVHTILITGRPWRHLVGLLPILLPVFSNIYTSNGASLVAEGLPLSISPIDREVAILVANGLRRSSRQIRLACEFETVFRYEPGYLSLPATYLDCDARCVSEDEVFGEREPISKVLCRGNGVEVRVLAALAGSLACGVEVTYSCAPEAFGPLEILSRETTKGKVVDKELLRLGVSSNSAVAFGDSLSDISMLSTVAHGVLIGSDRWRQLGDFDVAESVSDWLGANQSLFD